MKKLLIPAALLLVGGITPFLIYFSRGACIRGAERKGGTDELCIICGMPGQKDAAVGTLRREKFPRGSEVSAVLRVQYRDGNRFIWAEEKSVALDDELAVTSIRAHNIMYAELTVTVTGDDGSVETYTFEERRAA